MKIIPTRKGRPTIIKGLFTFENIELKASRFEFHTRTPKSSNQNAVFIDYDLLIGYFLSKGIKLVPLFYERKVRI